MCVYVCVCEGVCVCAYVTKWMGVGGREYTGITVSVCLVFVQNLFWCEFRFCNQPSLFVLIPFGCNHVVFLLSLSLTLPFSLSFLSLCLSLTFLQTYLKYTTTPSLLFFVLLQQAVNAR